MEEKSIFVEFMGDTPAIRLMDLLITWKGLDYTLTEMTEKAGMSWSTLHRIFPNFIKNGLVLEVREVGRAKLYTLNQKNPAVKKLIEVYNVLITQELQKHEKEIEV